MKKIVRTIIFTGKNLNDVFRLSCVKAIIKTDKAEPVLVLHRKKVTGPCVAPPHTVLRQYDDGTWQTEKC